MQVWDTPVCSPGQKLEYQVAHHETANITCLVDAVPDNVTFTWRFNSSGSLLELSDDRASSWGTTSILPYTPASPGDYGLLLCTASNSIGTQHLPCRINVTAAKPPDLIDDCVIRNQTTHSVFVSCKGIPTVLPRSFTMEVRNSEDLRLITKVTNATPHFVATGLDSGTAYTLHVSVHSPMGASSPIKLEAFTVKTAEKRMGINESEEEELSVSPLIGVVAGAAAAIAMTLLIILGLAIKHCPRRQSTNDQHYGTAHGSLISECSPKETLSTFSRPSPASEERNPDLIPLKEECDYQLEELRVPNCPMVSGGPSCHTRPSMMQNVGVAVSAATATPSVGRELSSCKHPDWEAFYQRQHHLNPNRRHYHQPSQSTYLSHDSCEVMSGVDHLGIVRYLPQPPVSSAVYATPTRYICHNTEPPSSSPLLESQIRTRSNTDCGVEAFRHESSV
ncbi:uncharacterized protein LOC125035360 [Penaeus chinensis]|uniref:uncharacterized protein LOC125035360 n=1 Tax=Penaeus chinensis TaxID=139456 RepID=UPI001FB84EEF|nr:uncharacterized protein LOC125035360 [Penaeus chinensis]